MNAGLQLLGTASEPKRNNHPHPASLCPPRHKRQGPDFLSRAHEFERKDRASRYIVDGAAEAKTMTIFPELTEFCPSYRPAPLHIVPPRRNRPRLGTAKLPDYGPTRRLRRTNYPRLLLLHRFSNTTPPPSSFIAAEKVDPASPWPTGARR